ncbi:Various environmental stresses-induced protein (plasmid) [Paracoccaceae bacterium]|nr:Various environmental stresses-induced protein [Paracoccaceae bacterium]
MRLLARREYTCQPWRNGGGETAEIAVRPGAGSDFLWRLSLATITRSGPFSTFPGVSRLFTLVEGGPVSIRVGDAGSAEVAVGDGLKFPGDAPVRADLAGGPAMALNIMYRPEATRATIRRLSCIGPTRIQHEAATGESFLFLGGACRVEGGDVALETEAGDTLADVSGAGPLVVTPEEACMVYAIGFGGV